MKEFHFSKTYFNKLIFNDDESNIRVLVNEIPSFDISEEEYSLRVETRHEEKEPIHRKYPSNTIPIFQNILFLIFSLNFTLKK